MALPQDLIYQYLFLSSPISVDDGFTEAASLNLESSTGSLKARIVLDLREIIIPWTVSARYVGLDPVSTVTN